MELWILFTIFAAFAQNLRFVVQKYMTITGFSPIGATFARFLYTAPLIVLIAGLWMYVGGEFPEIRLWAFLFWGVIGGLTQTLATILVVALFKVRNFSVGITLKKSEIILSALLGFILLGDRLTWLAMIAIIIGSVGIFLLSDKNEDRGLKAFWHRLSGRAVLYGVGAGLLFAICAVAYRATTLAVLSDDFILRALLSIAIANCFQLVLLWGWLCLRASGEVGAVIKAWRFSLPTSLLSLCGSFGWFCAFTLKPVAYVYALGQIEVIFALLCSVFLFRERPMMREIWGTFTLSISIILLVFAG